MKLREFKEKFLRLKGSPAYIAKGVALGTFIGMTPFPGFQLLIALGLAKLLKVHKTAAALAVFNTNVFTGIFIFAFNYYIGTVLMNLKDMPAFPTSGVSEMSHFIFHSGTRVFGALFLGGIATGIPSAVIMFYLSRIFFQKKHNIMNNIQLNNQPSNPTPNSNYTLITGAGTGLGKALAKECAGRNMNLVLTSLPGEDLPEYCKLLIDQFGVDVACLEEDLRQENSVYILAEKILGKYPVDMLINNAGVGGSKAFGSVAPDYLDNIIMVNVRATAMLTRLLLPELQKHKRAYILNVASLASFSPFAFKTVYPASKAFIWSFSRGLYEELKGSSVFVGVIHPGPMATNADVSARIKTQGWIGQMGLLSPERVAKIALKNLIARNSLVIPGTLNKLSYAMMKTVPTWLQLSICARIVRREFNRPQINSL